MKRQSELKSSRYGISFRPSTKSTVLFALATFLLVIHAVKSSAIHEEAELADNNRNSNDNSNGELNLLPLASLLAGRHKVAKAKAGFRRPSHRSLVMQ